MWLEVRPLPHSASASPPIPDDPPAPAGVHARGGVHTLRRPPVIDWLAAGAHCIARGVSSRALHPAQGVRMAPVLGPRPGRPTLLLLNLLVGRGSAAAGPADQLQEWARLECTVAQLDAAAVPVGVDLQGIIDAAAPSDGGPVLLRGLLDGSGDCRTPASWRQITALVNEHGVPAVLRRRVWPLLCGADRRAAQPGKQLGLCLVTLNLI